MKYAILMALFLATPVLADKDPWRNQNKNPPQNLCFVYLGVEICLTPPKPKPPCDPCELPPVNGGDNS